MLLMLSTGVLDEINFMSLHCQSLSCFYILVLHVLNFCMTIVKLPVLSYVSILVALASISCDKAKHARCFLCVPQISRLIYTNSGNAILALASNAIHLLWKWQRNDRNSSGKVYIIYTKISSVQLHYSKNNY